jgi:hypothetical protein
MCFFVNNNINVKKEQNDISKEKIELFITNNLVALIFFVPLQPIKTIKCKSNDTKYKTK